MIAGFAATTNPSSSKRGRRAGISSPRSSFPRRMLVERPAKESRFFDAGRHTEGSIAPPGERNVPLPFERFQ